jgi:hypothetical protein
VRRVVARWWSGGLGHVRLPIGFVKFYLLTVAARRIGRRLFLLRFDHRLVRNPALARFLGDCVLEAEQDARNESLAEAPRIGGGGLGERLENLDAHPVDDVPAFVRVIQ